MIAPRGPVLALLASCVAITVGVIWLLMSGPAVPVQGGVSRANGDIDPACDEPVCDKPVIVREPGDYVDERPGAATAESNNILVLGVDEEGRPVSGARVLVRTPSARQWHELGYLSREGRIEVPRLDVPGWLSLRLAKGSQDSGEIDTWVEKLEPREITCSLLSAAARRVLVVDVDGRPAIDAQVFGPGDTKDLEVIGRTDAAGELNIRSSPGAWLWACNDLGISDSTRVPEFGDCVLHLVPAGRIVGSVVSPQDADVGSKVVLIGKLPLGPVVGAVRSGRHAVPVTGRQLVTDETGRFDAVVPCGPQSVQCTDGALSASVSVIVERGGVHSVDLILAPASTLTVVSDVALAQGLLLHKRGGSGKDAWPGQRVTSSELQWTAPQGEYAIILEAADGRSMNMSAVVTSGAQGVLRAVFGPARSLKGCAVAGRVPLADWRVRAISGSDVRHAVTDRAGCFCIGVASAGPWQILITAPWAEEAAASVEGYVEQDLVLNVAEADAIPSGIRLAIEQRVGRTCIKVRNVRTGNEFVYSGSADNVVLRPMCAGDYMVTVEGERSLGFAACTVPPGTEVDCRIALRATGTLHVLGIPYGVHTVLEITCDENRAAQTVRVAPHHLRNGIQLLPGNYTVVRRQRGASVSKATTVVVAGAETRVGL